MLPILFKYDKQLVCLDWIYVCLLFFHARTPELILMKFGTDVYKSGITVG